MPSPRSRSSEGAASASLLAPELYWRKAVAHRVCFLVDSAAYFAAAMSAIRQARRSILLLGWSFDPRTRLQPSPDGEEDAPDEIGNVLKALAKRRPELDVRVLVWKSALPISASQDFFPHRARQWFSGSPVKFRLDASVPYGACHHQKVLVIDDRLAFCGGGDFCPDRWDTPAHLDEDPRRIMPGGEHHGPRHEVMMMMDGPAAQALAELARLRWLRSSGSAAPAPPELEAHDPWPRWLPADLEDVEIAVSRTEPAWRTQPEVNEIEALHLHCIRQARRTIYLENQYFTSPIMARALALRLAEPEGPEVVLVTTERAPSYFDHMTMDRTRAGLLRELIAADRHNRFRAYFPRTSAGKGIIVHSKVAVIDDRLVRIGSANLNNRSCGFDTECDAALEARRPGDAEAIVRFRSMLLGHFLRAAPAEVEMLTRERGLVAALDHFAPLSGGRLEPLEPGRIGPLASLIAAYHLGDPLDPRDSWRPLLRRRRLREEAAAVEAAYSAPRLHAKIDH